MDHAPLVEVKMSRTAGIVTSIGVAVLIAMLLIIFFGRVANTYYLDRLFREERRREIQKFREQLPADKKGEMKVSDLETFFSNGYQMKSLKIEETGRAPGRERTAFFFWATKANKARKIVIQGRYLESEFSYLLEASVQGEKVTEYYSRQPEYEEVKKIAERALSP